MALIYAGIDEAGYGPMLGPLCVAYSSFSVNSWNPGDKAPDMWLALKNAVCVSKKDAKTRIAVGDSKKLKLANSTKSMHPLLHLERAVLSFIAARDGHVPTTDIELLESLGAKLEEQDWYQGDPIKLPLGIKPDLLAVDISQLSSTMAKTDIRLVDLHVRVVDVTEFNSLYTTHRSKASSTELALNGHLAQFAKQMGSFDHARLVCDRQSGRTRYHNLLSNHFENLNIEEETPRASRYTRGDELGVVLTPQADDAFFPVALASMAAKLVRELAMIRFNRYWSSKLVELKPTAGYVQDARRWLDDSHEIVSPEDRKAMVRLA
jgi:ribonuclease HII